ncbi:hypothetical protein JB92DRAFT_2924304 [Gautieria morchelliformis]|nr:hypothetical protein JB92DRAFT_2924304 [Gautieria morchelliformis]
MRSGTCCPRRVGSAATHLTFREASSGGAVPPSTVPRPPSGVSPQATLTHGTPHPGLPPAAPFSTLPSKHESTHCPAAVAWFSPFLSPSPLSSSSRAVGHCAFMPWLDDKSKTLKD